MNSDTQLKVMAYLDNELSPGEARKTASLISSDREAQELYSLLRSTKDILAGNEPEHKLEDSREFYWSKIQRQIATVEHAPAPRSASPWWVRLLAPLAGTVALFALVLSVMNPTGPAISERSEQPASILSSSRPVHGEIEDLAPDVSSVTFRSEEDGVTVVWLSARQ
jgi:anti-sigma factor RsiW